MTNKTTILVVDDHSSHRRLQKAFLEKAGYSVALAESAEEAYEQLGLNHPEQQGNGISLINMDINMPKENGLQACERLQTIPHLKNIPVLFVTTESAADNMAEAIRKGGVGFVRKPICEAELIANVELVLNWQKEKERNRLSTIELTRLNKSLSQFSSIASHDLKEPLRKVITFGKHLQEKYNSVLDSTGLEFLARMVKASERMQDYIENLLQFSRAKGVDPDFIETDLKQLAHEVMEDLSAQIEASGGNVKVNKLPTLYVDRFQMRQLFQNLISNAIKFHRPGVPPEVTLDSRETNGSGWEITVTDNGIGFDESQFNSVLKPFGRLNGRGQFEGTGLGMAICNEIVQAHGGCISATSAPGEGTVFCVTFPAERPKHHGGMNNE